MKMCILAVLFSAIFTFILRFTIGNEKKSFWIDMSKILVSTMLTTGTGVMLAYIMQMNGIL